MDDEVRRERSGEPGDRRPPDYRHNEDQDDLDLRRRDHDGNRPALTRREREERWPIG